MTSKSWLIYGANGYSARLIVKLAHARGLRPILAGRNREQIQALAAQYDLPHRVVGLDDPRALAHALSDVDLVLHCAGPFSKTSAPMIQACLEAKTHYTDLTGEYQVMQAAYDRHEEALRANVMLMPAMGFDVVPTDCLLALVAERVPGATALELGLATNGRASRGTGKSAVEGLAHMGAVRRNGVIVNTPFGQVRRTLPFMRRARLGVAAPWGDLASAYRTTGIGDITVYFAMDPRAARVGAIALGALGNVLAKPRVQSWLAAGIDKLAPGPDDQRRARGRTEIWARASAPDGRSAEMQMIVGDPYDFTATVSVACVERVLAGAVAHGAVTPARVFGPNLVRELDGVQLS